MTRELLSNKLLEWMRAHARVAVAFSGVVDSTVVAAAAFRALGTNAIAVTGLSPSLAEREQADCVRLARQIGIKHLFLPTYEFEQDAYRVNDHRRCYFCKNELYRVIHSMRDVLTFDVICSGTNADDLGDYRPGLEAAASTRSNTRSRISDHQRPGNESWHSIGNLTVGTNPPPRAYQVGWRPG